MTLEVYDAQGRQKRLTGTGYSAPQLLAPSTTSIGSVITAPYDGQEVRVQNAAMLTDGIIWTFRYNPASGSAYKWEAINCTEWEKVVDTTQTTASGSYVDLATAGPAVTNPLPGDYHVKADATLGETASGIGYASFAVGGTAAIDADAMFIAAVAGVAIPGSRTRQKTIASTGQSIAAKYRSTSGTPSFSRRRLALVPIRVS